MVITVLSYYMLSCVDIRQCRRHVERQWKIISLDLKKLYTYVFLLCIPNSTRSSHLSLNMCRSIALCFQNIPFSQNAPHSLILITSASLNPEVYIVNGYYRLLTKYPSNKDSPPPPPQLIWSSRPLLVLSLNI